MYIKNNLTEMIVDSGLVAAAPVAETGEQLVKKVCRRFVPSS
jgi:hypothetical protein